ncbi:hypothetical protein HY772_09690 [Candidatus Woesearchaeota archaeon]|nr:hypothetical protein [Candidatus Woesearchaeota archaeon]
MYVSTEFTNESHNASEVVEWASHETAYDVDRLMTDEYGFISLGVDEDGKPVVEF